MSALLVRAATSGDLTAIERLTTLALTDRQMFLRLIDVSFHHLDVSPPTSELVIDAKKNFVAVPTFNCILASLQALATSHGNHRDNKAGIQKMLRHWPQLLQWLDFCVLELVEPEILVLIESWHGVHQELFSNVLSIMGWLILNASNLPGYARLSVRLWLYSARLDHSLGRAQSVHRCVYAAGIQNSPEFTSCLVEVEDSVSIFLTEITRMHDKASCLPIRGLLVALVKESVKQSSSIPVRLFHERIVGAGGIEKLMDVSLRMIRSPVDNMESKDILRLLHDCAGFLLGSLQVLGAVVAEHLLKSRFLSVLLQSPLLLDQIAGNPDIIGYVELVKLSLTMLTHYLFHPSVLRFGRQYMRRDLQKSGPISISDTNPFHEDWIYFHSQLRAILSDRRLYKLQRRPICGYRGCPNSRMVIVSSAKRCSGCLSEYYCSKECQKRDWIRHQDKCQPPSSSISFFDTTVA
ncbi:hypothetical protein C8J56DRAFT_958459 [Mycena floridula]|nr:hypothetical protein C8J56DRAFT_958459 [Mycena floridula]